MKSHITGMSQALAQRPDADLPKREACHARQDFRRLGKADRSNSKNLPRHVPAYRVG